ncbi:hypothetical protein AB0E67_36000 [Streptomyces sp. NPDC032161]|uniref:hypothetical protein n=1 Tax=unclassified Streptomyces TaxID=2593676 RepID=UPI0033D0F91B
MRSLFPGPQLAVQGSAFPAVGPVLREVARLRERPGADPAKQRWPAPGPRPHGPPDGQSKGTNVVTRVPFKNLAEAERLAKRKLPKAVWLAVKAGIEQG